MEKIVGSVFIIVAIYTLQYPRNEIFMLACNYILTMLTKWYGIDFGINMFIAVVYPTDVICCVLFIKMVVLTLRKDSYSYGENRVSNVGLVEMGFFRLFAIVVALSVLLGAFKYGMSSEFLGDIRKFMSLVIPILYYCRYPIDITSEKVKKTVCYTMNGLIIFCYFYWIVYFLTGYGFGSSEESMRCISSDAAYVVSLYTIWLVNKDLIEEEKGVLSFKTIIYIVAILVIQFNSAYMTLFSGITILIVFNLKKITHLGIENLVHMAFLFVAIILFMRFFRDSVLMQSVSDTFEKFSQATSSEFEGTIGGRYEVWSLVIATLKSPLQWLFGKPMGTGYHVRLDRGIIWEVSPHSGYVECLMRTGIIGIILLLIPMILLVIKGIRSHKTLLSALIVGILFYWYPYSFTLEAGIVIGHIVWNMYNDKEVFINEKHT